MNEILEKIKKLNAKAESLKSLGSEEEAQVFAEAVRKLLDKHDLAMTDLQFEQMKKIEPIERYTFDWSDHGLKDKFVKVVWQEALASLVAKAHNTRVYARSGEGNKIGLLGRKSDCQIAEYMIVTMVRTAESIADKEYVRYFYECKNKGDVTLARGFRASWLTGFVTRIRERYEEMAQIAKQDQAMSMALVRRDTTMDEIKQFISQGGFRKAVAKSYMRQSNVEGVNRGKNYASGMSLNSNAVSDPSTKSRQIS
jgi:hypothetical protein